MMTIEEKINVLPLEAKKEANDFIDFLIEKAQKKEDKQWRLKMSEKSIDKIWNNPEDDVYNDLLKG
jgi:DNA-binding transcriptional regulator/RsmH inhibitor MraZ